MSLCVSFFVFGVYITVFAYVYVNSSHMSQANLLTYTTFGNSVLLALSFQSMVVTFRDSQAYPKSRLVHSHSRCCQCKCKHC